MWLRRLSTDRVVRRRLATSPEASLTAPLAISGKRGNAELLVAIDDAAERRGLHIGVALAQARAMYPTLDVVPEDADADATLLDSIADWCLRYTPLVACDTPDGLLLDITGCTHLYGGERELVADLAGRLERSGFAFSLAIAGTIGAAWAAAHHSTPASYANGDEPRARAVHAAAAGRALCH